MAIELGVGIGNIQLYAREAEALKSLLEKDNNNINLYKISKIKEIPKEFDKIEEM